MLQYDDSMNIKKFFLFINTTKYTIQLFGSAIANAAE